MPFLGQPNGQIDRKGEIFRYIEVQAEKILVFIIKYFHLPTLYSTVSKNCLVKRKKEIIIHVKKEYILIII